MTTLDSSELLHLAMESANRDQHGDAVSYLKQALEVDPGHAQIRFFLGAEYAQIGMIDRAVEAMGQALEIDPSMEVARFQLGLLHLTSARPVEASAAWEPLGQLPQEHPLYCFKTGLESLARDEFDECRTWLTRGMAVNTINAPLNGDMQKVLDAIQAQTSPLNSPPAMQSSDKESIKEGGEHVLMSAYKDNTKH